MFLCRYLFIVIICLLNAIPEMVPLALAQASGPAKEPFDALIREETVSLQKKGEKLVENGWEDYKQRHYQKALESFEEAVRIFKDLSNRKDLGRTLLYIGIISFDWTRYEKALGFFSQALDIANAEDDWKSKGVALNWMGETYRNLGRFTEALTCYQQALAIAHKLKDHKGEGRNLANIGNVHVSLGQYKDGLQAYQQALTVLGGEKDQQGVGVIHISLGTAYTNLGDDRKALENFRQAREILNAINDQANESTALTGIGLVYNERCQNNLNSCLKAVGCYQQALEIQSEIDDLGGQENTVHNLGGGYDALGWKLQNPVYHAQALDYYQKSLFITQETGGLTFQARTLNNIGEVYIHLNFYEKKTEYLEQALRFLQEALAIQQKLGDRGREWMTLGNIGWVYELRGKFQDAVNIYQQAIDLLETIIESANIEELKIGLGAQAATTYQRAILLLVHTGQTEQAFELSEHARSRAFLDQLGNIRLSAHSKSGESLFQQEQVVRSELAELDRRLRQQRGAPVEYQDPELIEQLKQQLTEKRGVYEDLLLNIKLNNPEYASLVRVDPLNLDDVQQLLNQETTLLSYFVTPDKTLAYIVTRNTFETVELSVSEKVLKQIIAKAYKPGDLYDPPPKALEDLYIMLIAPLKKHFATPIIGVIPHGILHYVSFAALTDGQNYFSDKYTLFSLPSASMLKFVRQTRKSDNSNVLAMANNPAEDDGLLSLPYAEQEVQAIAKLYHTEALNGEHVSETSLKRQAKDFSILHIAAHGELNPTSPLFSRLLLAPDEENDGALEVHEVYEMDLSHTDLVVLSACDTNLGERSSGDDIIGLNRAFMYAGASSVVASLWKVNDYATKDFMIAFYKQLKRGKSKAEALQIAQQETRHRYPHPYFWAGFVLTGDPGKITNQFSWLKVLMTGLLLSGILIIVFLMKLKLVCFG